MSKGLLRSKRGLTSSQVTVIIPIVGSKLVTTGTGLTVAGGTAVSVAIGAPGFGSILLQGFPKGNIQVEEALANLQFTCTDANITAAFSGVFSVGTAQTASATLTGTSANIVASTAIAAATAGVSLVTPNTPAVLSLVVNNSDSVSGTSSKIVMAQPTVAAPSGVSSQTIKTGPNLGFYLNLALSTVTTAAVSVSVSGQIVLTYSITGNY
ncbi:hypothetical protein UFOVP1516_63 [uncultured Caudovirales phage]|uniref:Uncharacterized protein n=1 Tax=uncultured Caudovirales phage TaxID=2100421 RepID=A0A6J5PBL6_9CAUD|nr:hypothetical protein UFOVP887_72 [uncultured Caudovirales phage]CAB5226933.1 hypothetical protein UFOVP1516_63 [uncultured Caudovirales phage]